MSKFNTKMISILGLLLALEIILSRFLSLSAWNIKIGFSFIPVAVAATLFGPFSAGIVAALGDFLGAVLFPIGPYFPGFTLTAFLTGLTFGYFLYKRQTPVRILIAVLINQLVLGLLVNTLWISILYGSPFMPLLETRLVQCAILGPVQFICIELAVRTICRYGKWVESA